MMQQFLNRRHQNGLIATDIIGRSLVLGWSVLAMVLPVAALPALAEPTLVAEPGSVAQDAALKKLAGQWLTAQPLEGDLVIFVFAPDGTAFLISGQALDGTPLARQVQYRINASAKPMHLDVMLNQNTTVATIFEFTPNGDLRIQMLGTGPDRPRPDALTEDATIFQRISDETTLPPKTRVIPPPSRNRNREGQG